jgi:histidinol phosphatase-like PHP family hydrolase
MNTEPVDIYVNPTFLPEAIAQEYDQLWTPERMQKVIEAAKQNDVAIEINSRYRIPSAAFIKMAKKAGLKFSLGTNNADRDLGRSEYGLEMIKECGLTSSDLFIPKPVGQKKIQTRPYPQFR